MRKIFLTIMCALSLSAMAQGIIVHETNNNQTTYKSSDVERIEFSSDVTESTSSSYATKQQLEQGLDTKVDKSDMSSYENRIAKLESEVKTLKGKVDALLQCTHLYVDLGLSVKWATCNVGAVYPEEYGDYFVWGETEPFYTPGHAQDNPCKDWQTGKTGYNWSSYLWCNGSHDTLTKYCMDSSYGIVHNKTTLDPGDDVAQAQWGGKWRMPTHDEIVELRTKCTWKWTTSGGVNGCVVTGPNGNSIFLPAAGYRIDNALVYPGTYGLYWSSSLCEIVSSKAYYLGFYSSSMNWGQYDRDLGLSVRPVCP